MLLWFLIPFHTGFSRHFILMKRVDAGNTCLQYITDRYISIKPLISFKNSRKRHTLLRVQFIILQSQEFLLETTLITVTLIRCIVMLMWNLKWCLVALPFHHVSYDKASNLQLLVLKTQTLRSMYGGIVFQHMQLCLSSCFQK